VGIDLLLTTSSDIEVEVVSKYDMPCLAMGKKRAQGRGKEGFFKKLYANKQSLQNPRIIYVLSLYV